MNVKIYTYSAWSGWWEVNIRKMFAKVINMSYRQKRTIFTDFDSNGVVRNKKTIYFR